MTRLAVLGSPIGHSQSPALHRAAYAMLGLDWQYEAIEMDSAGLGDFVSSRPGDWRGLSLTMPLKRDVVPLLEVIDPFVQLTGVANTVLFAESTEGRILQGFNTDVIGIVDAFRHAGIEHLSRVWMLGAGATAASALVAAARLGVREVEVSARSLHSLRTLFNLGERLGIEMRSARADDTETGFVPDAIISTLPGGANHPYQFDSATRAASVLFDVAYDPWPSPLAARWLEVGGRVIPGIEMLIYQALLQVRIFLGGSADRILPREEAVLAAMRECVGL